MREAAAWMWGSVLTAALVASACSTRPAARKAAPSPSEEPAVAAPVAEEPKTPRPPASRSGSALARLPDGSALVLADEDHDAIRTIPLPVDVSTPSVVTELSGHPAELVAFEDRVLVTVRDPGALVALRRTPAGLEETGRVALPADAWGLALTADLATAIVTSSWSHRVSAVDLASMRLRWSINVGREPRGVAVTPSGVAYVSHLVGADVTRIDDLGASAPRAALVELPAAPLRTPYGAALEASLGYAPVLSADGARLFVPRMALGAEGPNWWFGASTVDVLLTATDAPLAPPRAKNVRATDPELWQSLHAMSLFDVDGVVPLGRPRFVQPRAATFRAKTDTVLVAGEGDNVLVELDGRALDPALQPLRTYALGTLDGSLDGSDPSPRLVVSGGAPSAIALSEDETMAYVFCRSTYDLMIVRLDSYDRADPFEQGPIPFVHLADDPLGAEASAGRRLFYDATDTTISGGLACAGCHPEGRDDGHVWHELVDPNDPEGGYRAAAVPAQDKAPRSGHPRQTPMLAGRVADAGPYGWHGNSARLEDRLRTGFALHRWGGSLDTQYLVAMSRPKVLAAFLRQGLVPPPSPPHEFTAVEERGKTLFDDPKLGCATCHEPRRGFTDRSVVSLNRPPPRGFDEEQDRAFKTPSLLYVGGTPPYFHDGKARSLEQLVATNGTMMGNTSSLTMGDRAALVAYLYTLGSATDAPAELPRAQLGALVGPSSELARASRPARTYWALSNPHGRESNLADARNRSPCWIERKGEWAHLGCDEGTVSSVEVLAGDPRSVETWADAHGPHVVFPLRPGDRRIIQLTQIESLGRWGGITGELGGMVDVSWLQGEAEPTLVLR